MEDKIEKYVNNAKDNKCYKNNVKENLSNYKRDIEYKLSENDIHIDLSLVAITLAILAFFIPFLSDEFFSFLSEARLLESSLLISDNVVKWLEIFLFLLSVVILVKLFRLLLKGNKVRYDIRLLEFQLEIVNKYLNTIS